MSRQTRSSTSAPSSFPAQSPTPSSSPHHPDLIPTLLPADQAVGTPLLLPKPDEWTRIYVQNPNGLSIGASGDLSLALDNLSNYQCNS